MLINKVVAIIRFLDKVVSSVITVARGGVHPYFDFFDSIAYFLIRFNEYINMGYFTELTF